MTRYLRAFIGGVGGVLLVVATVTAVVILSGLIGGLIGWGVTTTLNALFGWNLPVSYGVLVGALVFICNSDVDAAVA